MSTMSHAASNMHANTWANSAATKAAARSASRAGPVGVLLGLGLVAYGVVHTAMSEGSSVEDRFSKRDATVDPSVKRNYWQMPVPEESIHPLKRHHH